MSRYAAGETLASIARTYDCSPPAISYVVSRCRARQPDAPPVPELKLEPKIEPPPSQAPPPANGPAQPEAARMPVHSPTDSRQNGFLHSGDAAREAAAGTPPAVANGHGKTEERRTLHLSFGGANGHAANGNGHGGSNRAEAHAPDRQDGAAARPAEVRPAPSASHPVQPSSAGDADRSLPDARESADAGHAKDPAASSIDRDLRARVGGDVNVFLAAFDAALQQDTQESRSALREATDRLLRAGARTRIELERLEARMPLPRRDDGARQAGWRQR